MIFSIDGGIGQDKVAYRDENNEIAFSKEVSVYAEAPDDAYDMPLFDGRRYYTNEVALMEESDKIINVTDFKLHEFFSPLSLWSVFERLSLDKNKIDKLVIGLSLEHKKYAKGFVKRMTKFKVNGEVFDFTGKIMLTAQALGAKYAIDHFYYKDNNEATFGVIDIGMLSIDRVISIKGKAREESADGKLNEGVIRIAQKIIEKIGKEYGEVISIKEAQEILLTKTYGPTGDDLSNYIEKISKEYTYFIVNIINQRYKTMFSKFPTIYFVGGGSYFLDQEIIANETGKGRDKIIFPKNAEYYNAIGYLLLAEDIERKKKQETM